MTCPRKRDGVVPVVHILPGGSLASPADAVTPGVLERDVRVERPRRTDATGTRFPTRPTAAGWRWPAGSPAAKTR